MKGAYYWGLPLKKQKRKILLSSKVDLKLLETLETLIGFQSMFICRHPEKQKEIFLFVLIEVDNVRSLTKELKKGGVFSLVSQERDGKKISEKLGEISSWEQL